MSLPRWLSNLLTGKALKLTPTTIQSFLANGVTDPYTPAVEEGDFADGNQSVVHLRATTPGHAIIKSLPRTPQGTIVVLTHGGDGGAVTTQAATITLTHMEPDYDGSNGGDNSVRCGFYCPGQRKVIMMPADTVILRMDTGHTSYRVIAQTNSGRVPWSISDLLSVSYDGSISPAALAAGDTDLYSPTGGQLASVWRLTTDASGSGITGLVPPVAKHWNGSAYAAHRDMRVIYNLGPGTLTLKMNASGSAEYKMVGDSLSNHAIPIWGSRILMYEPQHNFWLVTGKP